MKQIILALLFSASFAMAMEWETAFEVAVCPNRAGYETVGARAVALLREHDIKAMLMYFDKPDRQHIEALTEDAEDANRWGLYVHISEATKARRVLKIAIDNGLRIKLTHAPKPQTIKASNLLPN